MVHLERLVFVAFRSVELLEKLFRPFGLPHDAILRRLKVTD
jgi:hypothetical protein